MTHCVYMPNRGNKNSQTTEATEGRSSIVLQEIFISLLLSEIYGEEKNCNSWDSNIHRNALRPFVLSQGRRVSPSNQL